jgi:DNA gyrase subunit A
MDIEKGDELISAKAAKPEDDAIMVTEGGHSIRFTLGKLRTASRSSGGVQGISLRSDDKVVAMDIVRPKAFLLTVTANGYGKRSLLTEHRAQFRGGKGLRAHCVNPKTGAVADAAVVELSQQLMLTTEKGSIIRMLLKEVPRQSRNTQGVRIVRLSQDDRVASIALLE